ncbi:tripartite tricarboxylate transporter substrate binding protein [Caenimonas koreensis DSM 17982]|uniref:Tripartite tricarboxylate transporter substrate binding protein n=1 Tax=Caenimonas koreensis DSM 17982 TaxID=1121255 RepID=A0A844AR03_9BURK|nr:tripartite tricarboxylate transporter substrate binding protein [Caenimonas koreensis]MRD46635.1 tripartite tricarboxylate transporter substrate binding protein [Caenimonas koreensis DSM 17982]
MLLASGTAHAADAFPQPGKAIRFVVPYPPGGPTDLMARILAPEMRKRLGVPVVVDNRAGAGGNLGTDQVAKSAPDGHTILLAASGPMAVNGSLYSSLPYSPIKDLAPVIQISAFALVLEVNPSVDAKNLKEFIAALKAKPDAYNFASAGNGTPQHLAGELFKRRADVKMQHVAYKGAGPALNDVLGGQVPIMFDILASSLPHIAAGKLRPIAVTTAKRSSALPDVPTLAELGMTGFDFSAWHGIAVAGTTPAPIIKKLNETFNAIFADPAIKKRWEAIGSPVVGGTPEQFGALVRTETVRLGRIVKETGAVAD